LNTIEREPSGPVAQSGHVNAHTHLYSGLSGLGMPAPTPAPQSFVERLARGAWRMDRAHDAATLRASARLYVAEALLAGTTALLDHHESPELIEGSLDIIADACQELGIRAVLCYGATERNSGAREAERGLEECRRFISTNRRPLVRGVVGLHASFTVSDDSLRAAGALARELGTVVHVHVAEDVADLRDAQERGYPSPLARLLELGALPEGSILAHGVHLTEEEVRRCAALGLWLVNNPRSNRDSGVGYARELRHSAKVALGTDGYPADLRAERQALLQEAKRHGESPVRVVKRLDGGQTLVTERFAPAADVDASVATGSASVAGREVVRDGVLLSGDIAEIRAQARAQAERLWARMAAL